MNDIRSSWVPPKELDLAHHYEQLRGRALNGPSGTVAIGFAVFLRGGMKTWMQILSRDAQQITSHTPELTSAEPTARLPKHAELTSALASLLLNRHYQEKAS